ncbi:MAG: flavin reductase [Myxococcales bacterium]|nr:flavin reductase [Myxococcales bacterium]
MAVSPEEFKACLGCRVSGVAIVTSCDGEHVHGMTVSDFTSVSLDPPLVVVSLSETANTLEVIRAGKCFAVNVLSTDQVDLSNVFASEEREDTRFEGLSWSKAVTGAPLIPGSKVMLDCTVVAMHVAGDHVLCIGQVEHLEIHDVEPLVYYQGGYRDLRGTEAL